MNTQLEQYIQTHKVSSADFLVFRDWEEFLNILFSNNGQSLKLSSVFFICACFFPRRCCSDPASIRA